MDTWFLIKKAEMKIGKKQNRIFNKWCWSNWIFVCRRMRIDIYISPCTKLKFPWIKDCNINPDKRKFIEEKVENILEQHKRWFPEENTDSVDIRSTINKLSLMIVKGFYQAKDTINRTKWHPSEWKDIFINPLSDKVLISKIYKELKSKFLWDFF